LLVLTLAAEAGLIVLLTERVRHRNREEADPAETAQTNLWILVLSSTLLLTVGLHIVYNLTFVQHQGRYLFPALIPIAVGYVAGLGFWFQPLITRQSWARWLLPLGLAIILLAISFYALWRILPGLAPG
jgi:hypothetical protein